MKTSRKSPGGILLRLSLVPALLLSAVVHAQVLQPSLWIGDDRTKKIYQTELDGTLISSFELRFSTRIGATPFLLSPSGISVDDDGTLWIVSEDPGRIVHYSRTGEQLGEALLTDVFGAIGPEGVSVAADPDDDTLWVVDDPGISNPKPPTVYHIEQDGTLIDSFPVSVFDPDARSPQGIATDPLDGSLWIVDNSSANADGDRRIYHIEQDGTLIDIILSSAFDSAAKNLQGVSISYPDGTLWLTDRDSDLVYNIDRDGTLLSSFPTMTYDLASENATSIAFEASMLGTISELTVLALYAGQLQMDRDARIEGDAGVGPWAQAFLKRSLITGTLFVDPDAGNVKITATDITGGMVVTDLAQASADAEQIAMQAAALVPDQSYGVIEDSTTIVGRPGLNVISIEQIELNRNEVLTLVGGPGVEFVVNVSGDVMVHKGSDIVLQGGSPEQLLFTLGGEAKFQKDSTADGFFVALDGQIKVQQNSTVFGAVISGEKVHIRQGSAVIGID